MATPPVEQRARRRAGWTLGSVALAALVVVAVLVVVICAHRTTAPKASRSPADVTSAPAGRGAWNAEAEDVLAARPMVVFPPQDAQPQPLTTRTAGSPISLPHPSAVAGHWIPDGFPGTPAGALSQLKALDEQGLVGGDPDVYARAYRLLSLPGAPDPGSTGLSSVLTSFRAAGGLPGTGPAAGVLVNYQVSEGLIKGSADGSRYTVVCVLGEFTVRDQTQTISAGVGDCQALRWIGTHWRISSGALAASAPCAWPGSEESVDAGYRELS
jgi:hypothetical protein